MNENKLSKIFSDVYETGKSCIGSCAPLMSILTGVIPVMKWNCKFFLFRENGQSKIVWDNQ
jgi:hypothetical protein